MYIDELSSLAMGRTNDLFMEDIEDRKAEIAEYIGGKRVLIIAPRDIEERLKITEKQI